MNSLLSIICQKSIFEIKFQVSYAFSYKEYVKTYLFSDKNKTKKSKVIEGNINKKIKKLYFLYKVTRLTSAQNAWNMTRTIKKMAVVKAGV